MNLYNEKIVQSLFSLITSFSFIDLAHFLIRHVIARLIIILCDSIIALQGLNPLVFRVENRLYLIEANIFGTKIVSKHNTLQHKATFLMI